MKDNSMEILAIIPARGGSKGIPRKNLADLCGKPLLAYSIEAALAARDITRVIVSTEDPEIARVAQRYGAEVPFLRPAELASDNATLDKAFDHMLEELKARDNYNPSICACLYPTHPFRNPRTMNFLTGKLLEGYTRVSTARRIRLQPETFFRKSSAGALRLVTNGHIPPQDYEKAYFRFYGSFEARYHNHIHGHGQYIHFLTDPIELIDIDEEEDLRIARYVIERNLYDFSQQ